jgi:hypothetical protein
VTPQDIITEARDLVQDSMVPYRYSDAIMLRFVNDTFKRASVLRPDLFGTIGDIPLTPGSALQSCPAGAIRFIELFQVKGGSAIVETTRVALSRYTPNWMSALPGTPTNFMRYPRNPTKFFVYPPPVLGTVVTGEWAATPVTLAMADMALLPDAYMPVMVDGVVALAEVVDNEHVENGRAKFFADRFEQTLVAGLKVREVTDFEDAGTEPDLTTRGANTPKKTYAA